jgi:phenylalanyl-tRNA synthetase beta chain
MRVSFKWLREYIDISAPPAKIAERLTMAGLEVGGVQSIGGDWDNVEVGEIVRVEAHPNADRLRLVTVDLVKQQPIVVCGAPNLTVGDKIAFAHVGARLIDDNGQVAQLKPAKIRGIVSGGMVCSERELGISDRHEGIMVLPSDAPVGTQLAEYLGDTILDLDVTPNRPDCLSVIGIAREIAALVGSKCTIPEVDYEEAGDVIDSYASVEIVVPEWCFRYCASLLTGIKVGQSPQWLQQRLLASGMRPINNVVDVTNYVMLEYGQPLHAFDCDKIRGKKIIVRRADNGEVMTTLDGVERALSQDILVIADKERAVAIAGIMGGLDTEVIDNTSSVLIESASFNQAAIHRGGIKLKLSSEASLRFEKGLSRELPLIALRRATQLMSQLAGGKVAKGVIDVYPGKQQRGSILLSAAEVKRLLGIELDISEIVRTLELLGFSCKQTDVTSQVRVDVPWWRTDISCDADLVEEVVRIVGYDIVPTTMLSAPIPQFGEAPALSFRRKLRSILVSCGFQEVLTYSLTNQEMMRRLSPELSQAGPGPIRVANPMSREYECLRTSLRPGLLSTLERNERYQENGIRLFEIGKVFLPRPRDLPQEKEMLCAVLNDLQPGVFWRGNAEPVDFVVAKGMVETLLDRLELPVNFEASDDGSLYPGRTADIIVGEDKIGVIGELHPRVSKTFELTGTAYLIEIDLDKLSSLSGGLKKYQPISRYPSTTRDIALVVDEQITYEQVYDIIQYFPLVSQVSLFDLYSGKQIAKGKKSFAFRIVYQSPTRTLTDEEVDEVQQQILAELVKKVGAALRA